MLPFHKRSRMNSAIEIGTDELEAIELPRVRPPSVRPAPARRAFSSSSFGDDEMTIVRVDRRVSTSPPPRAAVVMPRIPPSIAPRFDEPEMRRPAFRASDEPVFPRRRYADDEPTTLHPSSTSQRPLLSMTTPSARTIIVEEELAPVRHRHHEVPPPPPPSSRALLDDSPRSSVAVDAGASSSQLRAADLSMTSSLTGSADIRKPGFLRAATFVAFGVFAGLVAAFAAHGDGLSTIASLVDPSHVSADVAHNAVAVQPQQQAPVAMMPGAGAAQPQQAVAKPAAPSCNADAVPAAKPVEQKVERKVVVVEEAAPAKVEAKPVVQRVYVAAPVHHEPAPARVAAATPVISHPAAPRVSRRHGGDEMESASAADALAKAQLDAALSR